MPANIAVIGGKVSAFAALAPAWWDESAQHVVQELLTWEQAMRHANLDWKAIKQPLFAHTPAKADGSPGDVFKVPDKAAIFRSCDGAYLGTVGADYHVIDNQKILAWMDGLVEAEGGAHYASAGALGNGGRVWAAIRVPSADMEAVPGDKQFAYLVGYSSHDGSVAATLFLTYVRPVCQNTLSAGLAANVGSLKVRHTKGASARMEAATKVYEGVGQTVATLQSKLSLLAHRRLTRESVTDIMNRLFPKSKAANAAGEMVEVSTTKRNNIIGDVLKLYEVENARQLAPESAYALLQAVTDWTDHLRTARVTESRAREGYTEVTARGENSLFNGGAKAKNEALEIILEATNGAEIPTLGHVTLPTIRPYDSESDVVADLLAAGK